MMRYFSKRSIRLLRSAIFSFFVVASLSSAAQLYIGAGAQLQLTGNARLTLQNSDLINNGSFLPGNSTVYFTGPENIFVSGGQPVQFYSILIDKTPGSLIVLQQSFSLSNRLQLSQGSIDLNGHNLDLGSTGQLSGESETSRILGPAGGEVIFTVLQDGVSDINPGNLGAQISSLKNLGNIVIKRGHRALGLPGKNILRYFEISPDNNNGLEATLRFNYLDAELTTPEKGLVQWSSKDGVNWIEKGRTSYDTTLNFVEKTGITDFSVWTLATSSRPLPVVFSGFNLYCEGDKAILRWKTTQEINSSHFTVERNTGSGWTSIGDLPATGNSHTEKNYEFTDPFPVDNAQYRIAQFDLDAQVRYTPIVLLNCVIMNNWQLWPNPFGKAFSVRFRNNHYEQANLRVSDARGAIIINRPLLLIKGINQFQVDLQHAASGAYFLTLEWPDGRPAKTIRVIKQ